MRMASSALALPGQLARLLQLLALAPACCSVASILRNVRVVGIHAAQTVQRLVRLVGRAHQLVVLGQAGQGFRVVRDRRAESAARTGRPYPAGRAIPGPAPCPPEPRASTSAVPAAGFFWAKPSLERQQQATQTNRTLSQAPQTMPHRRFHSTFSSPSGPNRNLPSRKPVANRARF